jgi:hypothetical protein
MSHAKFAPSSAVRWMNCPGSIREEAKHPDAPGPAAQLGTLLHEIAATALLTETDVEPHPDLTEEQIQIAQQYVGYARGGNFQSFELFVRLNNSVFGTADAVGVQGDTLDIGDFKTGLQPVAAFKNPQLLTYAACMIAQHKSGHRIKKVRFHIIQPALKHFDVWETDDVFIKDWTSKIEAAVEAALDPEAPLVPSDEACAWCKARFVCKARARYSLELARQEFALIEPNELTLAQLSSVLLHKTRVEKWLADAYAFALEAALKGTAIPNFELGETRSVRAFANEPEVKKRLLEAGYSESEFVETKLLALTNVEKLVGRKKFAELFGNDLVVKKPGKPALIPCTESVPSLSSVATLASE